MDSSLFHFDMIMSPKDLDQTLNSNNRVSSQLAELPGVRQVTFQCQVVLIDLLMLDYDPHSGTVCDTPDPGIPAPPQIPTFFGLVMTVILSTKS